MSDSDSSNNTSNDKNSPRGDSDRPLGALSDFRGNSDNRENVGNEPANPPPPGQDPLQQQPPQADPSPHDREPDRHSAPPPPAGNDHHRAGTGMYWAAALIALALLTLFFNNRLESKQQSEGITEKLLQQADGHYYARGKINNQPVLFIVDTGASVISIPATLADSMGLPRLTPERVNTANGQITVFNTRPVTIRLGDIQLYDVEAHINPGMEPPGVLLGMSFLRRLDFRQRDSRLILKTRPEL